MTYLKKVQTLKDFLISIKYIFKQDDANSSQKVNINDVLIHTEGEKND